MDARDVERETRPWGEFIVLAEADLVIIEVQHGERFEEGDIVRLDDDYGRSDNR